jgi:hypothetical protein
MAMSFSVPRSSSVLIYPLIYLFLVLTLCASRLKAQTTATWNDGTGNWSNAKDWSPNGVPRNAGSTFYNVVINGTGSDTITFDSSGAVINSLSLGAGETLQDNGHSPTLTIGDPGFPAGGTLTNAGTINWRNGSTLTLDASAGSGSITNSGVINLNDSTLKVNGDFGANQGSMTLQNGSVGTVTGVFNDVANLNNFSEATVTIDHSSLSVKGDYNDGSYLGSSNPTLLVADGGSLKIGGNYNGNYSNVSILSGSSATVLGSFNNPLNLVVDSSSLVVNKDLNANSGVCCYSSSVSIQNDSSLAVHGNLNVGGESTLTLAGASNGLISGNLDNFDSTVSLVNSTLVVKGNYSTETIGFNYLLNGSHLVVDGSLTIDSNGSTGYSFLNLVGSGNTAIINGGVTNSGTVEVDAGSALTVNKGGFANVNIPDLPAPTVNLGGSMAVNGGFTNNGGSVLLASTGKLMTDTYTQNGGLTDVSGALVAHSYQQSGGSTVIETGGIVTANTFNATGGTVTVNGVLDPTAVQIGSRATLQGSGIVNGNLFNRGNFIAGTAGTPLTFNINGNYTQNATGIFTELIGSKGNGLLNVSGTATLVPGASLNVQLASGFDPKNGTTFTIMDYGSEKGSFTLSDPYFDNGKQQWAVSYGAGGDDIVLTAQATKVVTPEPGTIFLVGTALLGMVGYAKKKRER